MNHSFKNTGQLTAAETPVLFLPGWGFDGRIVQLLNPAPAWIYPQSPLDPATLEQDLVHLLTADGINRVRLIGWSMGAMLGLAFAARYSVRLESLVLAALRPHWPSHEIAAIRTEFSRDPAGFLQGFYRKCFLGNRQAYGKFRAILEPHYLADLPADMDRLQRGLDFLTAFRLPAPLPDIPVRLLHGRQDIIAPAAEMAALPGAAVEIIDNAGHAVFLHKDSSVRRAARKEEIRAKFSRAADSYDDYAKVQTEVAHRLAGKLSRMQRQDITTILEIGCGTGNFTALLADRFPAARILALDFSAEMLARARPKLSSGRVEFIRAEGEQFLEDGAAETFDLVAGNGSLQWFADADRALHNIARILTPEGAMLCSIFGPQSLHELGEGLAAVHLLSEPLAAQTFPVLERLQRALQSNFPEATIEEERLVKEYPTAHALLTHIKKTGTSGWQRKIQEPLTRSRIQQLDAWFKKTYDACRVTYQVFFLQAVRR